MSSWEERYKKIIEQGKKLKVLDEGFKVEDYKVKGCQAQVWLRAYLKEGKVIFESDSDALITKGLIALLLELYSGLTPKEILDTKASFFGTLEFEKHLSLNRSNGLLSMLKQIKFYATAFLHQRSS